jgi:hypothetical protein
LNYHQKNLVVDLLAEYFLLHLFQMLDLLLHHLNHLNHQFHLVLLILRLHL